MIVSTQPILLKVKPPCKVFGNIHGQYTDLMRFFDVWKFPGNDAAGGDISANDYIFLGNFVDRGSYSLEVICLLMALKVKYPDQVHLIRGAHEDKHINYEAGLGDECKLRLKEDIDDEGSVFAKLNEFFEYLPLAATIKNKIFCVHGGIGSRINRLSDIEALKRPIEVPLEVSTQDQQIVVDLLWSEPTDSEEELGIVQNTERDPAGKRNMVKFGPDRIDKFLKTNYHYIILRSHDIVSSGFSKFADGQCITINSCTNYVNKYKNNAGFFVVQKKFEMTPKIIRPLDEDDTAKYWQVDQKGELSPLKNTD
jgi:diadenosine tetraphosphatase ApaH/serine/threonine PP2A family protein phosphatase